ncbi:hypothetical protein [Modestobacter sp. I12A-02662]|uniref:hypothetical protein n=1 Tax=Modestobacter sp. I12A-02662 TaxID=1730496 RepID=UPI0034DEDA77
MSDPQGSDRIQQDVPTASGTGDDSSTGTDSFGDVPLTRDEAVERDQATGGDQSARVTGQPELAERAKNPAD